MINNKVKDMEYMDDFIYYTDTAENHDMIFYNIETPKFPSRLFGGVFILGIPGYETEMICGSAIQLSGGYLRKHSPYDNQADMMLSNLIFIEYGMRFAEDVVANLVSDDNQIIIFKEINYDIKSNENDVRSNINQNIDVLDTQDGIVYLCQGKYLSDINWLEGVTPVSCNCLIGSHNSLTCLGEEILNAANKNESIRDILIQYNKEAISNPSVIKSKFNEYTIYASLGGLDTGNIIINMPYANISNLRQIIYNCAIKVNIKNIFDAGTILDLENHPDYYSTYGKWQSIPDRWIQI